MGVRTAVIVKPDCARLTWLIVGTVPEREQLRHSQEERVAQRTLPRGFSGTGGSSGAGSGDPS